MDEHPGGRHLLRKNVGKDATTAFFGGVYDHSNAAHNLLAMMRVGVLRGGLELESEKAIPPSQRLEVMRGQAIAQLRAQAAKESIPQAHHDQSIHSDRDSNGLPSPPLSTGALHSEDEGATGECAGLNLSRT
jgi:stearoyl-CoA desaturase (delta-9 desaturase)